MKGFRMGEAGMKAFSRQPSPENQCAKSTAARSQTQVRHPNESQKIVEAPMNQQDENFRMRGYIRKKAMQSHHHHFSPQTALEDGDVF